MDTTRIIKAAVVAAVVTIVTATNPMESKSPSSESKVSTCRTKHALLPSAEGVRAHEFFAWLPDGFPSRTDSSQTQGTRACTHRRINFSHVEVFSHLFQLRTRGLATLCDLRERRQLALQALAATADKERRQQVICSTKPSEIKREAFCFLLLTIPGERATRYNINYSGV